MQRNVEARVAVRAKDDAVNVRYFFWAPWLVAGTSVEGRSGQTHSVRTCRNVSLFFFAAALLAYLQQ
jgi:hypothetical protein